MTLTMMRLPHPLSTRIEAGARWAAAAALQEERCILSSIVCSWHTGLGDHLAQPNTVFYVACNVLDEVLALGGVIKP